MTRSALEAMLEAYDAVLAELRTRGERGEDVAASGQRWRDDVPRCDHAERAISRAFAFTRTTSQGAGWLIEEDPELSQLMARASTLTFRWQHSAYAEAELKAYQHAHGITDDQLIGD